MTSIRWGSISLPHCLRVEICRPAAFSKFYSSQVFGEFYSTVGAAAYKSLSQTTC